MTDPEIVQALRSRDERALQALRTRLGQMLRYHSEKLIKNPYEAEEIVNDAFLALWKKAEEFDTFTVIKAYLFEAVRFGSFKRHRKYKANANQHEDYLVYVAGQTDADIQHQILEAELFSERAARVEAALQELPERRRQILRLYIIHNMKPAEIAQVLGLKTQSVKNLRNLGIKMLQQMVAGTELSQKSTRKRARR